MIAHAFNYTTLVVVYGWLIALSVPFNIWLGIRWWRRRKKRLDKGNSIC